MADDQQLPWTEAGGEGELVLLFDAGVYSIEAIQRAAYWMTDRCFVAIDKDAPAGAIRVHLAAKSGELPRSLAGELGNRALDEEVRRQVLAETKPIREAIVAQAFAEAELDDNRSASFAEDPERLGAS